MGHFFFQSCRDADELTDTITSYVRYCQDSVSEIKTVKMFSNNKPWVSKQLKMCLNERKVAFRSGNTELLCEKRRQLRGSSLKGKLDFKNKIEGSFLTGNVRQAWKGLNTLMGRQKKR